MTAFRADPLTLEKLIAEPHEPLGHAFGRCELCAYPGGERLPCEHCACDDCRIGEYCYKCFAKEHPGTPVVVSRAGRKGYVVLWGDGDREECCDRRETAYGFAVYLLSGVIVGSWEEVLRMAWAKRGGHDRRAMHAIIRVAVSAVRTNRKLERQAPGIMAWLEGGPLVGPVGAPVMQSMLAERARNSMKVR